MSCAGWETILRRIQSSLYNLYEKLAKNAILNSFLYVRWTGLKDWKNKMKNCGFDMKELKQKEKLIKLILKSLYYKK